MIINYKVCPGCGVFCIGPNNYPNNYNNYAFRCVENPNHLDIDQSHDRFTKEVIFECKYCKCRTTMDGMPTFGKYLNSRIMKRYKEIERGIEYEVFEFNESEKDYQAREIEKIPYSKIVRVYSDHKDTFYFKKGEGHNEWGPAIIRENSDIPKLYYMDGNNYKDDEWKVYYRTKMIDEMLYGKDTV